MLQKESTEQVFQALIEKFKELDQVEKSTFLSTMKAVQKETGVKGKNLWMPVRIALTGEMHGPELPAVIEILGKDVCIERLQKQIS
jgi:nondiscriminating glutamyl-tRNA synthetase